jgi:hypothetical protein
MVAPLRKHSKGGKRYKRRPEVEHELERLEKLELKEVVARAREGEEKGKPFLSSEALVHILRREVRIGVPDGPTQGAIDALAAMLIARCTKILKRRLWRYDELAQEEIADEVMKHLMDDVLQDGEKADYTEINFNHWLARNRSDAVRKHKRKADRFTQFGDTVEDLEDVEVQIVREGEPTEASHGDTPRLLLSLKEARERGGLPSIMEGTRFSEDDLHRIAEAARQAKLPAEVLYAFLAHHLGLKVESENSDEYTLVKHFKKSEKTIRSWIKRAEKIFAELRKAQNESERNDESEPGIGAAGISR